MNKQRKIRRHILALRGALNHASDFLGDGWVYDYIDEAEKYDTPKKTETDETFYPNLSNGVKVALFDKDNKLLSFNKLCFGHSYYAALSPSDTTEDGDMLYDIYKQCERLNLDINYLIGMNKDIVDILARAHFICICIEEDNLIQSAFLYEINEANKSNGKLFEDIYNWKYTAIKEDNTLPGNMHYKKKLPIAV